MAGGTTARDGGGTHVAGDLTQELIDTSVWADQQVADAGIPIHDVPFVTIGGGIGSFVMVDYLRIAGVDPTQIRVLTTLQRPYDTYAHLCRNSQIPEKERLRSDSGSTPDNIWGFPAYAIREAWQEKTLKPLWNVLVEPDLADFWTPRARTVFVAMDAEAHRIRWAQMLHEGQVRMVRRRYGGGYFTIITPPEGTARTKRVAWRSRWVHLAVGYPRLRYLEDLQEYRERHQDFQHVVNAYEPHEHVYEDLRRRPGVVLLRGSGIVASRILQRLVEDRDHFGAQTTVVHLFRTYRTQGKSDDRFGPSKQKVRHGWAYQGFNVTKATWGGQHRDMLLKMEGEERKAFIDYIGGGAHTPRRKDWREQIDRGLQQGFYVQRVGEVTQVTPAPGGDGVLTVVRGQDGSVVELPARYVIDCTGLVAAIEDHRVLADLLAHAGARHNVIGRLDCEPWFEVRGATNPPGKIYASGAPTAGSYYGGVDSFLGLQYSAQQIYLDLHRQGFCARISPSRSVSQWWKWMRGEVI